MTKTAQRIAIAAALGWCPGSEDRQKDGSYKWDVRKDGTIFACKPLEGGSLLADQRVPHYPDSLDAVLPAAITLLGTDIGQDVRTRFRLQIFVRELMKLTSGKFAPDWPDCEVYYRFGVLQLILNLSPDKVCEALLRTLNLWAE